MASTFSHWMQLGLVSGFVLLLSLHTTAQIITTTTSWEPRKKYSLLDDMMLAAGVSVGQETFVGFPRVGIYQSFPLSPRLVRPRFGFHRYAFYVGMDFSAFVLFAGWFTASLNTGVAIGPVTVDNSWTRIVASGPDGQNSKDFTCNPKIGIALGPIWLKAGPTFYLNERSFEDDWIRINEVPMNFEIRYIHRIRELDHRANWSALF